MGEVGATQSLREAQVVLDRRALFRLTPGGLALHDHGAQALGRCVHRGGQAGRPAADDAHVVQGLSRGGAQTERACQIERRRRAERVAVRHEHEREVGRCRLGEVTQPPGLGVALDVVPAVGHVVARQKHLDVVAAVRPPVPDHSHVRRVVPVGLPPVAEQVVDDGVQPLLWRVPRFEQVVIKADVVDRLDGDVCVGVRRKQQELRVLRVSTRLLEHLDTRHLRHPLVHGDQRHRLVA
jgi:hypothetical protein